MFYGFLQLLITIETLLVYNLLKHWKCALHNSALIKSKKCALCQAKTGLKNNDGIVTSFSCIMECLWHKILLHSGNTNFRGTYLMSHLLVQDEKWSCDNTNLLNCQKGRGSNVQTAYGLIHRVRKWMYSTKPLLGLNIQVKLETNEFVGWIFHYLLWSVFALQSLTIKILT